MQLTPQEMKLVEKLRKQNRQWPRTRWVVLAMGVLSVILLAAWGYFLRLLILDSERKIDSGDAFVFALLWTKCCFYLFFGTWCITTSCTKWHGDVNRMLLLKLLDAQQKDTANPY